MVFSKNEPQAFTSSLSHVMIGKQGQLQQQARKLNHSLQTLDVLKNRYREAQAQINAISKSGKVEVDARDESILKIVDTYKETRDHLKRIEKEIQQTLEKTTSLANDFMNPEKRKAIEDDVIQKKMKLSVDILPKGRQVAAKTSKRGEEPEVWILATVQRYYEDDKLYEVEDEDPGEDEESGLKNYFLLPPTCIIPLANEPHLYEFAKNQPVLAVFPRTTSFYPAVFKAKKGNEFLLNFADDEDETGKTPTRAIDGRFVVSKDQRLKRN